MLIELFPEGFEEVTVDGGIEVAAYTRAGGEERRNRCRGGLERGLEAIPPACADRPALGGAALGDAG